MTETPPTETPPTETPPADPADLALALRLADAADAISLPRFGAADLRVGAKPDLSPVSDADLAVETAIRGILAAERPDDAVLGEEFGSGSTSAAEIGSNRQWVLDPIDGTKNFVRGVPVWGTLIALLVGEQPVVGVVSAPALARRWWGAIGQGAAARFNQQPPRVCRVSAVTQLADACLSYSELAEWRAAGLAAQFADLTEKCWRTRGFGDFWSYMLVAEGAVDIAAEPELNLWDLAALAPIVTEAGGRFTALDGSTIGLTSQSALATNGALHERVRTVMQR